MSARASDVPRALDELLEETNAGFARVRHGASGTTGAAALAAEASVESVRYVEAFWPRVIERIAADPARLGSTIALAPDGPARHLRIADAREAMRAADGVRAGDELGPAAIKAAAFAPLVVMSRLLNDATGAFADDLRSRRCPLDFALDPSRYVSLRALLPLRAAGDDAVGGNGPTLVMGGTATALALCWNLLFQIPRAWQDVHGAWPARHDLEALWAESRELLFRLGSGSLAGFVALASTCASNPSALVWDGAFDLALDARGERLVWVANADWCARYTARLAQVGSAQHGHYVGCAALYARAAALPLAEPPAEPVDRARPQQVFSELLRWVTAVARAEYFPLFAPA